MKKIIIINGCPGSGKTTISKILKENFSSPMIDFGDIRNFHLNREWSNTSQDEENMSFENLVFILKNYIKHGFENVIVNDLRDDKVLKLSQELSVNDFIIITLILNDEDELRKRVIGERDSGFKDAEKAIEWNNELKNRDLYINEHRIDNSHSEPMRTVEEIFKIIGNN